MSNGATTAGPYRDRAITLPDGRKLGVRETGDLDGYPVFLFSGSPGGCRLYASVFETSGSALGLRIIGVDRPGTGLSDLHPGATMADFAADIGALADTLGIERFAVMGHSGGGPFAVAVAGALPARVAHATLVAPAWLTPDGATRGMPLFNRLMWWSSRSFPWLFELIVARMMPAGMTNMERSIASSFCEPDQRVLERDPGIERKLKLEFQEAIRNGTDGIVADGRLITAPQPTAPADIAVPVALWHGEEDTNVPVAVGRALAEQLPRCDAHILSGEGHVSIVVNHREAILRTLRGACA